MRDQLHNVWKDLAAFIARAGLASAVALSLVSLSPAARAQNALPGDAGGPSATVRRVASDAQTLHVTVGHSIFLDTKSRLRRVYIADPAILDSITLSPNQIIVTAMTPGVTSLILLDEAGQAQSYVVSSDLNVDGLRTAMSHATRGDEIHIEGSAGRVILSGNVPTDAASDAAVKLATLYSKDVANALTISPDHPRQVRLKVRILEIDRSKLAQFGINLFNPGGNTSFLASSTTSQFPATATFGGGSGNLPTGQLTTSNVLNFLLYSSKLNLGATVQDLESKQVLQVLAEPTLTTISGIKADFLSGGEFPFPVIQPGGAGGTASVTIQFRPYGVKVEFTPTVNDDGTIRLKVAPEVSALDYTNAVTISGYTIPALSTRRAETEVELRSEQSFAISGLLDQRTTDMLSKTPGIASIPFIGALFKSKNINHSTTELVVIVTPTLVDPLLDTTEPGQPLVPVPTLNTDKFDDSLGKRHNPTPAAPPITPAPPFSNNQPPSISPASAPQTAAVTVPRVPAAAAPPSASLSVPQTVAAGSATESIGPTIAEPRIVAVPPVPPVPAPTALAPIAPTPVASAPVAPAIVPAQPAPVVAAPTVQAAVSAPQLPDLKSLAATPAASDLAPAPAHAANQPMVQIMALSNNQDAEAMVAALKRHGYNVAIGHDPQDSLLHLEVGPFASKKDAETMRQRLLDEGYNASVQ